MTKSEFVLIFYLHSYTICGRIFSKIEFERGINDAFLGYSLIYFAIGLVMVFLLTVIEGEELFKDSRGEEQIGFTVFTIAVFWPLCILELILNFGIYLNKVLIKGAKKGEK